MSRFLIALHRPYGHASLAEDQAMHRDIDALNEEMVAAGIRIFVGGLKPADLAHSLTLSPDGQVSTAKGPYLKTGDFVDGFWVLEVETEAEALDWGRKAARACRADVEVRPFY
jgi:hypothetical protein